MTESRHARALAITLRVFDYSETSQVVHLYTRNLGKIHAIAKGSKRKKSAFHGAFDILSLVDLQRMEKQPGTLDLLTSAETLDDFRGVRREFLRFIAASYCANIVEEFTPEAQPQPPLFDGLGKALKDLDEGVSIVETVFRFEALALQELGHFPRLDACGACERPLSGSEAWFSAKDGGVFCLKDPPKDANRFLVKRIVLDGLAAFRSARHFNLNIYPAFQQDVRRVVETHMRYAFEREPTSQRFFREAILGKS